MRRRQDASFVALAALHGAAVVMAPAAPLIAVGVWWNSNTIAHNFVHRPFFRRAAANTVFALYQSVLLGIPQTLWRERHLAHHADKPWRWRWSARLAVEVVLILAAWSVMAVTAPAFFAATYLPAYLAGLGLCAMQGRYEHAGAVTTSHYGRVYNLLCFNDGYHCEHHAFPGVHWSELPTRTAPASHVSRWPALLRWLEACSLDGLEALVLTSPRLQRFVVEAHTRALALTLVERDTVRHVAIIGGGLFPRTALVCRDLMPDARVVIIDANRDHLDSARALLDARPTGARPVAEYRHETFVAGHRCDGFDLVVVPLAFRGDRQRLYANPPARLLLAHDWCWRVRGSGRLVSLLLLKRVNLVRQ
ncbi:MAG TPA: fatty acid desaturase [Vicinamibacterales bacterium]|nr:fatty acid desaturase [Vicinamibacterales bacterium]